MANLFDPFEIRGVTFRNRIGVSPMCQYSSSDGKANDWHLVHLGSRAVGGAGLIIVEATAVDPCGRISPGDAGLWHDEQIEPLKGITQYLKQHGAVPAIQLAHAGRKASAARPWDNGGEHLDTGKGGWEIMAPSAIPFGGNLHRTPHELKPNEIAEIRAAFVSATKRSLAAGFQVIELHAAHGYLAHSFLSPLSNKRTDEYGGSLKNRARFLLETANAMRQVLSADVPFFVRLSAVDWDNSGLQIEDTVEVAKWLKELGVDLIDCSSGFVTPAYSHYPFGPSWQVPLAERIKREAGIAVAAVGMIVEPVQADEIIRNQRADLVLLARQSLRDPYWPYHAAKKLNKEFRLPIQYQHWVG